MLAASPAPPGSAARVRVLAARLRAGVSLWHPGDERRPGDDGITWHEPTQSWRCRVRFRGGRYSLGLFALRPDAERARVRFLDLAADVGPHAALERCAGDAA